MTTAAQPFRKIPIFRKFPEGHWLAGLDVERGRLCACNRRWFPQGLVNPDYLDALRAPQSKAFVERLCEIEPPPTDEYPVRIWTPRECWECARKTAQLTPDEQLELQRK